MVYMGCWELGWESSEGAWKGGGPFQLGLLQCYFICGMVLGKSFFLTFVISNWVGVLHIK